VVARWTTVDPLAEKMRRFSPYDYGDDNSIRNIDPDGMETEDANCCGTPGATGTTGVTGATVKGVQGATGTSNEYPATEGASVETISSTLTTTGTITTVLGYVGSVFGPEVPAVLVPIGEGLSTAGDGISVVKNVKDGNYGSAATTVVLNQGFGAIKNVVEDSKEITQVGKIVLGATNFVASKVADKTVEVFKADHEQKNKVNAQPKLADTKANKDSEKNAQAFFKKAEEKKKN